MALEQAYSCLLRIGVIWCLISLVDFRACQSRLSHADKRIRFYFGGDYSLVTPILFCAI